MSEVQRSRTSPSPTGGAAGAPGGGPRRAAAASTTPVVSTVRGDRSDSAPRPRHDQAGSKNDYDDNDNDAPSTFGPSLPRHLVRSREGAARDHSEGDDDDDDAGSAAAFGPALPPHLVRNRASDSSGGQRNGNSSSSVGGNGATAARDEGRVYGPARPPQKPVTSAPAISVEPAADPPRRRRQAMGPAAGPPPGFATASGSAQETRGGGTDEDNDDDGFGPKPLPSGAEGILEDLERQERLAAIEARASRSGGAEAADGRDSAARKGGREEWMLVPPAPNRLGVGGPDMKSRTFSMSTRPKEVDQSGWTALPGERKAQPEQPERKKRRTEDEPPRVRTEAELATHEFIRQHNEARRGESLMDAHARAYGRGEAASASAAEQAVRRGFDRERDVVGRRVDAAGRRRMLEDAARLGGRFSHGSRGDFL